MGHPPYPPVLLLKMLFLSYLYNVSERAMEELADLQLLVRIKLLTGITFRPQAKGRRAEQVTPILTATSWA